MRDGQRIVGEYDGYASYGATVVRPDEHCGLLYFLPDKHIASVRREEDA